MASPFSVFRKRQKLMLAILGVLAMLAFVVIPSVMQSGGQRPEGANPEVASTKYGVLRRSDIESARAWFSQHSSVKAFPHAAWDAVLARQSGEDIFLPIDVYGFAGGQAFRPGVPCLVFEGPGGIVSYLESAMCRYFAPVLQATKARLMREATPRDADSIVHKCVRTKAFTRI